MSESHNYCNADGVCLAQEKLNKILAEADLEKLPWADSSKWKPGYWYPMPTGHDIEFNDDECTVDRACWSPFRLDPQYPPEHKFYGDIDSMEIDADFITVVKLCNELNPEKLWTASWIKEPWAQPRAAR